MEIFVTLCFLFVAGSIYGWVQELFYRRIKHKRWINPGFLVGCYLPIYGTGVVLMFVIARTFEGILINNLIVKNVITILIIGITMTLIEFVVGLIFIKGMNIKLWDYSKEKGNVMGIICPKFSLIWTVIGVIYLLVIDKYCLSGIIWLSNNLAFSFLIGLIMGIMLVDLCYSINLTSKIKKYAKLNNIIIIYENLKEHIADLIAEGQEKFHFIQPFRANFIPLIDMLETYYEKIKHKFAEKK